MRLLIVLRQTLLQQAVLGLISGARPAWSCSVATEPTEAECRLAEQPCDLLLADLAALGDIATEWISKVGHDHPHMKVVVLVPDAQHLSPLSLLNAGAHGILDGAAPLDRILIDVLQSVLAGALHLVLSARCALPVQEAPEERWGRPSIPLTPRQQAVMRYLSAGCSVKEIARRLDLSIGTVKTHLSHTYIALGARNRIEAISRAGFAGRA